MPENKISIRDHRTGKEIELPISEGTMGQSVVNISLLSKELELFTFDPGFSATASCESQITFIDGEKGILLYRGYSIEELASCSSFLEVAYLLLKGELPTKEEFLGFCNKIKRHSLVHEGIKNFYNGFRRDAHPMSIMVGVVGALSSFYHDSTDIHNEEHREISALRLIAKMPTLASACYKYSMGQPFMYPENQLDYVSNFLRMMFAVPSEDYQVNPVVLDALEKIFILHADHEQNASTSTVRLAGSSQANPFACISSGITALWGPAHGGANEAVLRMLEKVNRVENIPRFIDRAKDKNDPFRLMGFGHRVYKNYDPRAKVMKETCHRILQELQVDEPLLDVAMRLEEIALKEEYFIERKLYPNVDFYSGIILKAIGIPVNMFTVIFALARTVGWVAHWIEMYSYEKQLRIGRPRQLYKGATLRSYMPIQDR